MTNERYRLGFHIAPKTGWLNDPNGLCQFRGVYHAFFQFNPVWPNRHQVLAPLHLDRPRALEGLRHPAGDRHRRGPQRRLLGLCLRASRHGLRRRRPHVPLLHRQRGLQGRPRGWHGLRPHRARGQRDPGDQRGRRALLREERPAAQLRLSQRLHAARP